MRLRPDIINFPCCFSFAWWVSLLHRGLQHQRNIHDLGVIDWVLSLNWSDSCLPLQQIIQGIFTWMRHYRTRSRRVSRQTRMCYHFKLLAYKHELSIQKAACLRACILESGIMFLPRTQDWACFGEKDPGLESMWIKISWSRWLDLEYCHSRSVALSQNCFRALEFLRKWCRVRRIQVTGRIGIFDNRSEPYHGVKDDIRVDMLFVVSIMVEYCVGSTKVMMLSTGFINVPPKSYVTTTQTTNTNSLYFVVDESYITRALFKALNILSISILVPCI